MKIENFDAEETLGQKIERIETIMWKKLNEKYDLIGIKKDDDLRKKLYDLEKSLFLDLFFYRTIYWRDLYDKVSMVFTKTEEIVSPEPRFSEKFIQNFEKILEKEFTENSNSK